MWRGENDFTSGFTLGLFPPTTMKKDGPTWITTNPSLQSIRMPAFAKPAQLPDEDIRDIEDYDLKLERIVERYIDYDIRAVAGTTCWFSLLFDKLLEIARAKGRRAESVTDIWPNLRVLVGGGVSADPYLPVLRERMGTSDFALVDTYNATEGGIFAATDHSGERGMLMIPDRGVFFEFVPVEEVDDPWPKRVPLWAVEKDRLYAIHVTTPSGLYSYRLGDLVRFPSIDPLRVEFAGRLSGCLSTTQELTTHVEIQRAVESALAATGTKSVDYGCAADVGVEGSARSRYVLFVEFAGSRRPMARPSRRPSTAASRSRTGSTASTGATTWPSSRPSSWCSRPARSAASWRTSATTAFKRSFRGSWTTSARRSFARTSPDPRAIRQFPSSHPRE
ncbi:MAG: GH3 auxin-responsive promoter family protein [Sandaracinaceae bacterium]|nr:GH3 auxin-responsive promoter family protein [Sandaracinaceae bacterium]